MDRLSWHVALAREQRALDEYASVVGEWNAQIERGPLHALQTLDAYLEYLSRNSEHTACTDEAGVCKSVTLQR
jgi:hypothetical protein